MSHDYNQGVFSFFNGFERSSVQLRDKLRVQGFEHCVQDEESAGVPAYEAGGTLSEMFKYFPPGETATAAELLENRISAGSYGDTRPSLVGVAATGDWFLNRQEAVAGCGLGPLVDSKNQIPSISAADPAEVIQLFLTNPQHQRPPSSSPSDPPTVSISSSLHMLLPDPSSNPPTLVGFNDTAAGEAFGRIKWPGQGSGNGINPYHTPRVLEGRGLSLSLSSSLQHLEAVKDENLGIQPGNGDMILFGHTGIPPAPPHTGGGLYNLHSIVDQSLQMQAGLSSSFGALHILKNSKYTRSAQELLEEFCSVGSIAHLKRNKRSKQKNNASIIGSDHPAGATGDGGGADSASKSKDLPPPSASDRLEYQRRKVKLSSMVDEVDRKYSHYCMQMQMVVNSFDTVMGSGAAAPYTSLAQKAMSKHFRGLKEAISAQLKLSCEILGDKDAAATPSGLTKGETPRLRIMEQSLRQNRGMHQMGLVEQGAWRPQRGLPDRSVNILRAWLFEHFLNPYPSDADKHQLARQTGLSRNQVSNWFINARVRLWKPMVEEMYQKESKEESQEQERDQSSNSPINDNVKTPTRHGDDSSAAARMSPPLASASLAEISLPAVNIPTCHQPGVVSGAADCGTSNHPLNGGIEPRLIRLGTSAGDVVSLTLGLRHAVNSPEKRQFPLETLGDVN